MLHYREVTIILGQNGCGKSYLANEILKKHPRVHVADAGFQDFDVVYTPSFEAHVDYLDCRGAFDSQRPFRAGYDYLPAEHDLAFQTSLKIGKGSPGGAHLLVLEEADRFSLKDCPAYEEVIYRGRHHGIHLLAVSLAPKDLPTDLRRQCNKLISFRQIMPDDIDWISEIVGEDAEKLITLPGPAPGKRPPFPYMLWTPEGANFIAPK